MAGCDTIKLFKFVQKIYQFIGISPSKFKERSRRGRIINAKNWFIIGCHVQYFLSTVAYLLFEANSMIEYGMVFYTCTTVPLSLVLYLILIWTMESFSNYIENCERFIEKSEYCANN